VGPRLTHAAIAALLFVACHPVIYIPMGSELGDGTQARCQLARDAWLAPVKIEDPNVADRDHLEPALTLDLQRFLREERSFRRVSLLPGEPAPEDLILRFAFPRFEQTLIQCPGCNAWTVISMGMSANNMESWELHSKLGGRLRVERLTGEEIATSSLERSEDEATGRGVWRSPGPPSAIGLRAGLVRQLVYDACHAFPIGSAE